MWTNSAGGTLPSSLYNPATFSSDNFTYTINGTSPCPNDFAIVSVINNSLPDAVITKLDNVEIREFKNLIYASYIPINDIDRNNSFRNIANYIFGGNNRDEKIEMTSPVIIILHNQNEMAFIMPKKYTLNSLPKPNNNKIKLYEEKSRRGYLTTLSAMP